MTIPQHRLALLTICVILAEIKVATSFLGQAQVRHVAKPPISYPSSNNALHNDNATPTENKQKLRVPPGILGPPEPLRSLEIGQCVNAFRSLQYTIDEAGDGEDAQEPDKVQFNIERVSRNPDVFHLQGFVTPTECEQIKSIAKESSMAQAGTVSKEGDTSSRKNCDVAWLPSNGETSSGVVSDLVSSTVNIFLSKDVLSHPSAGVEDLQVLKYGTGGEFVHHHDGLPRILTVIYYINGVAGTWFPMAHTSEDTDTNSVNENDPVNKAQALDVVKDLQPGKDGLLVKGITGDNANNPKADDHTAWVKQGDAIAFYNYLDNGSAQLNWRALHCGLPTTEEEGGTKWIANHWYRLNVLEDM